MSQRYIAMRHPPQGWQSEKITSIATPPSPRGWQSDGDAYFQERPTITAWEADPAPQPTGLLDMHGVPIYRQSERVPIGFRGGRER